jgi:cytidylate kinase
MTRTIEAIVEEQARRWQLERRRRPDEARRPVITVARQHGARGTEVACRVAQELKLDLFDRELLHRIAESSHLSEQVVSALDYKDRELLTDWLASAASREYLSPAEYRYHLTRVVGAVAHQGGAVIIGRGSNLILGPSQALRVLVVAPIESRVRRVMERESLSDREARRRIQAVEADRRAFLLQYFHAEFAAPSDFDLTVNTDALDLDGCLGCIRAALAALPTRSAGRALSQPGEG